MKKIKNNKTFDIQRYNPSTQEGLLDEQVKERKEHKLYNTVKQKTGKSYFRIIYENVVTFFNLIWILIFIAFLCVQSYSNLTFMIVVFANTLISIIQECRAKAIVDKLSLVTTPKLKVIRSSNIEELSSDELLLDDVVMLEIGNSIPADCIVLDGKLEVNESLLTGESRPVKKQVGDSILAGSFIISGSCMAKVDKIGNDNYIQSIALEAKKFKSPNSNLNKDLKTIIKYIGIGIIPVGVIMFFNNFYYYSQNIQGAITKTGGSLVGMIPAGMFLLVTIALALGVIKLSKKKTMVKDLFSIEMLARSNVLCLDKTGTITDGTMQVSEIIDLNIVKDLKNTDIISNILQAQRTSNATGNAMLLEFGKKNDFKAIYNLDFSSKRKCTATSFEDIGTFILGAPEFTNSNLDEKINNIIFEHTTQGKRVLLLAYSSEYLKDEELPQNCTPLAIITIQDHIREDAYETIEWFKENNVQVKIISGDNPVTVGSIAKRVGVENADSSISLEGMSLQEVEKIANLFTVFGRVSPEQKHTLIKALKKQGNVVAMTGDGVNDTLALKEADCSIAMADGSEVARNLSNLVLMDSKFSSLPAIVKEGRQVINNVQQSSTLYLMKTLFTILLSLFSIVTLSGYPFDPVQLFIMELLVIGLPSVILALQPNTKLIKGDFIPVVLKRSVPSGLLMFLNVFIVLMLNRFGVLNAEQFTSLSTLTLTFTAYLNLVFVCMPISKIRLFCCSISLICIIILIAVMGDFFGITTLDLKVGLILLSLIILSLPLQIIIQKIINKIENKIKVNKKQKDERKTKFRKKAKRINATYEQGEQIQIEDITINKNNP